MSRIPLCCRLFGLVILFLFTASAHAQKRYDHYPVAPVKFTTLNGTPKTQRIDLANMTKDTLTLNIRFFGDETFTISPSPAQPTTLCPRCSTYYIVTFKANSRDSVTAWFTIDDGVSKPDTLRFYGVDTGHLRKQSWKFMGSQRTSGRYYYTDDNAWVYVYNPQDTDLTISATMRPGAYGFTPTGSMTKKIKPNSLGTYGFRFNSSDYDSAFATLEFTDGHDKDTISIWGNNTEPWPLGDTLTSSGPIDFGASISGTTACKSVTIYNRTNSPAPIASIVSEWNPSMYQLQDLPAMPLVVAAHDSLSFTVCFTSPQDQGIFADGLIGVVYELPAGTARKTGIMLFGRSRQCIEVSPLVLDFGQVPLDTTVNRTLYVVNYSNDPILIDSVLFTPYSPGFGYLADPSFILPALDSVPVTVSFIASKVDSTHYAYITFASTICPVYPSARLTATPYVPPVPPDPPVIYELFADSTQTLVYSDDPSIPEVLWFVNDHTDTIKVVSVGLKNGKYFEILGVSPQDPEFILPNDSLMAVVLQYIGPPPPATHDDTLLIVTENALLALSYSVHASFGLSSVDAEAAGAPTLRIIPNPASGPVSVAIEQAHEVKIEILDLMGNTVASMGPDGLWDPRNATKGSYFVRSTGLGSNGKPFVITQRVVIR